MKQQQGFTLVELIAVIVILGILAATALPKFSDLQQDARLAKLNGARASVQSVAAMAHAAYLASGAGSGTAVTFEGTSIGMSNGYPTVAGMWTAANLAADYTSSVVTTTLTVRADANHTTCSFTYAESVAGSAPVVGTMPARTSC